MSYINESALKSQLMQTLKVEAHGYIFLRHEDIRTGGIPDITGSGNKRTVWWEAKIATPNVELRGRKLQIRMCQLLAAASECRYIIWQCDNKGQRRRTLIVHPNDIEDFKKWDLHPLAECVGFDMYWLANYMYCFNQGVNNEQV